METGVIYARYSCERQTEQSIEGQLTICKKFADEKNIRIVEVYADRAVSGRTDNRAELQRLLRDSKTGGWKYVIVYKGDRFSRNRVESAINKKTLRDNGVKLVSATENIPDAPEGIILESLLEGLAEYYSAELSQKVKRGQSESIKKRQFIGGNVLYGYDIIDKKYVVNQDEAETVRMIFSSYADGKTVKEIKESLDAWRIFNKKGKPFAMNSLFGMLAQEQYTGVKKFGEDTYTDLIPRIVDDELFERVQRIRESHKHSKSRKRSEVRYILTGKVFCGDCGSPLIGDSCANHAGIRYNYYKCAGVKRKSADCKAKASPKEYLEDAVFQACQQVLNNGFIQMVAEKAYEIHAQDVSADVDIRRLENELKEKEAAIKNIVDAIEKGIYSSTTRQRLLDLEKDVGDIKDALASAKIKASANLTTQDYVDFLNSFTGKADEQFKEDVIAFLVKRIDVYKDTIKITFNYSPDDGDGKTRSYPVEEGAEVRINSDKDHHTVLILTAIVDLSGFAVRIRRER